MAGDTDLSAEYTVASYLGRAGNTALRCDYCIFPYLHIMGDLNKRRGRVLGMTPVAGGKQVIEADIPMTGLFGYCTVLRSMTGGRGTYEYKFSRYEQAPSDVQEREIAARAAEE